MLAEWLEKEQVVPKKKIVRRPVGRPKRDTQAVLLKPKIESMKALKKKPKVCYTNWFTPSLWPPMFAAVKQHRNI